jgi:hypothetical protein
MSILAYYGFFLFHIQFKYLGYIAASPNLSSLIIGLTTYYHSLEETLYSYQESKYNAITHV